MLRTLLCLSLAACAVTSPDPVDAVDPPPASPPTQHADAPRCGGVASDVQVTKAIADTERPLADVLRLRYPTQLDFSEPHREASMRRFQVFVDDLRGRGTLAIDHYVAVRAAATDPAAKAAATARLVQIHRHLAALLVHAEIPVDVRTGDFIAEKTAAFCENAAAIAAPFLVQADEAVRTCVRLSSKQRGWWTDVCVH